MEPWGTPALTFFQVENCLLRATRCFVSFKKSGKFKKSRFGRTDFGSPNFYWQQMRLSEIFELGQVEVYPRKSISFGN